MLVLSRKAGQQIHVGDEITIEIRKIAGNRVTIALEAPKEYRILRGELQQPAKEFEDESTYQISHHRIQVVDLDDSRTHELVG